MYTTSFNFFPLTNIKNLEKEKQVFALINMSNPNFYDSEITEQPPPNNKVFPGMNTQLSGWDDRYMPELVLPTFVKTMDIPNYASLWEETIQNLREATEIVVIGCSLRKEDNLLLLATFMGASNGRNPVWRLLNNQKTCANIRSLPFRLAKPEDIHEYTPETLGSWDKAFKQLIKDLNP